MIWNWDCIYNNRQLCRPTDFKDEKQRNEYNAMFQHQVRNMYWLSMTVDTFEDFGEALEEYKDDKVLADYVKTIQYMDRGAYYLYSDKENHTYTIEECFDKLAKFASIEDFVEFANNKEYDTFFKYAVIRLAMNEFGC